MYGTQALVSALVALERFENDVNMYGTQAIQKCDQCRKAFENDVNMYGTQAEYREVPVGT